MKRVLLVRIGVLALLCAVAMPHGALAHGDPIYISVDNSGGSPRLATDKLVYANFNEQVMELFFGVVLQCELPGFSVISGVSGGTEFTINPTGRLWYHDGSEVVDTPVDFLLENQEGDAVTIDSASSGQPGVVLGTYDASPSWHEHPYYSLQPTTANEGLYGIVLELAAPGYEASQPFLIVFRNELADESQHFDRVVELAARAIPVPGDVNFDGEVNIFDVGVISEHWLTPGPTGNANGDSLVDIFDVGVVSEHWLETVGGLDLSGGGASVAAVPEPSSGLLLALAALICGAHGWNRRRRRPASPLRKEKLMI